jgi:hypothetical protein
MEGVCCSESRLEKGHDTMPAALPSVLT